MERQEFDGLRNWDSTMHVIDFVRKNRGLHDISCITGNQGKTAGNSRG